MHTCNRNIQHFFGPQQMTKIVFQPEDLILSSFKKTPLFCMLAHQLHRAHEHSLINFFIFLLVRLSCSVILLFCPHGSNCLFFLYIYVQIKQRTVLFFYHFYEFNHCDEKVFSSRMALLSVNFPPFMKGQWKEE